MTGALETRLDVLLVEDNAGDAILTLEALQEAAPDGLLTTRRVATVAEAREAIDDAEPDCVLLDLGLPDAADQLDALRRILTVRPGMPVVVLTGLDADELASAAIRYGAQDYLVKRATPDGRALLRAVQLATQRGRAVADLRTNRDELANFARLVAHDLRSPLASIVGFADLLLHEQDLDDDTRRLALTRILDVADGMAGMVAGMLTYAQQAGADWGPVDLGAVVDWVRPLVRQDLESVDGVLDVGALDQVWSDEAALRTVLLNLLGNAIKYRAPDRRLALRLRSREVGGEVVLELEDNGIGIPAGDRTRVFSPGRRLGRDDEETVDGIGLGLSAVHRIVTQLDGRVWFEDTSDGLGVRACVALPGHAPDVAETQLADAAQ